MHVLVQPGASRTGTAGHHGDAVRIRIASPPSDGRANAELVRYLARQLDVPRAAIAICRGASSRRKVVDISGISVAQAARLLLGSGDATT